MVLHVIHVLHVRKVYEKCCHTFRISTEFTYLIVYEKCDSLLSHHTPLQMAAVEPTMFMKESDLKANKKLDIKMEPEGASSFFAL